ncbi:hypothetical protein [Borborobacter arsenicus]|uniref:hypothetical protein n=1 Tax=Borborobacter arsenicus TaxID=1851146 RepID=UPI001404AB5C|nr:hypothetical protein [Pseudaminobacter arsenicus]
MSDERKRPALTEEQVRALAIETGVSEQDIQMIVELVGIDRSSIVREARLLKKSR